MDKSAKVGEAVKDVIGLDVGHVDDASGEGGCEAENNKKIQQAQKAGAN